MQLSKPRDPRQIRQLDVAAEKWRYRKCEDGGSTERTMGVQVETIRPGDGKDFHSKFCSVSVSVGIFYRVLSHLGFSVSGKTFPKRGNTVAVHYVGKTTHFLFF